MPGVAADLLASGYDSPSLRRLAGETDIANSADEEPLVASIFRELGSFYPPSERISKLITSGQIASEVIAGLSDPWRAAKAIGQVWRWEPAIPELENIDSILDEVDWSREHRRASAEWKVARVGPFRSPCPSENT
jgi:hypothetical protein